MNNKCPVNDETLRLIKTYVGEVFDSYYENEESLSTLRSNTSNILAFLSKEFKLTDPEVIVDAVMSVATEFAIVEIDQEFFTKENITKELTKSKLGITLVDPKEATHLIDNDSVQTRIEVNSEFLDNAYGSAKEVKMYMIQQANQNIFDCCFINRGSIKGLRIGIVRNTTELNENIRLYLELLLKKITDYLKWVSDTYNLSWPDDIKELLNNPKLYTKKDGEIVNTNILNKLHSYINTYLSPEKFFNSDSLRTLYNTANNSTISLDKRNSALLKIDAYNANILLKHFDTFLSILLGKAIQISNSEFNKKSGKDVYLIAGKTASLATTWRVSENIDVEKEADFITKLAINTTPLYRWGVPSAPVHNRYLHFSDFSHIISKLKDLSYNENVIGIKFTEDYISNNRSFWNSLSPETLENIRGKRLSTVINLVRRNPIQYLHSVFEIFSNHEFYESYKGVLYTNTLFTLDELDKLYSLYRGIFSPNREDKSINTLSYDSNCTTNFYAYIAQTADSIFKINYIQYYKDDKGVIQVRTLIDLGINNIRRQVEQTVNTVNSSKLIKDWKQFKDNLNLKPNEANKYAITYDIPNTNIRVSVVASSGRVTFTYIDNPNVVVNNFNELWQLDEIRDYLDKVLRLGIRNSTDLQNALQIEFGNTTDLCKDLLSFAARVTLNLYIYNEYIKDLKPDERDIELPKIYGKIPNYNYALDELGLVHSLDVPTLKSIAMAKANTLGITIASLVKDGEGNALSNLSLSRLIGALQSLIELQESTEESATKDCLLVSMPGLFEGIYTALEFHDDNGDNKALTDFSVSEMTYAGLVYDFIGGIMPHEDVSKDGHVLFLPSVNSDKGTIGRIKINLNKKVTINGLEKAIKDLNSRELEELISNELGTIYKNMFDKVSSDWDTLTNFIRGNDPRSSMRILDFPSISNDLLHDFSAINNWWITNGSHIEVIEGKEVRVGNTFGEKSVVDFIKKATLEYNKFHRLKPLTLIDLVHYLVAQENDTLVLKFNLVFISLLARFQPKHLLDIDPNFDLSKYKNTSEFFNLKKIDVLKGLIKCDFKINTTNTNLPELSHIRKTYPLWVNSSGNVVLAKYNVIGPDGNIVSLREITSKRDLLKLAKENGIQSTNYSDIIDKLQDSVSYFELNPFIEQYNYLDYLFTLEFMISTVGSLIAHPEKSKSSDVLEQEAARFLALHKRNVSYTAQMHAFLLNLLNGIPEEYNLAVIDDITDEQATVLGLLNKIKPFDGATFVNPFVVILENNSLGGARAGITKKQFVHFKNERTGTGGIIKTAGFGLTNDWIRNSPFLLRMMLKMTDHVWLNEDGTEAVVDITHSYLNNKIVYDGIYFMQNGRYFKVDHIESLGGNRYKRTISEVDIDGSSKKSLTSQELLDLGIEEISEINTNYKLWNFFGGANSMTLEDGKFLKFSNTSVTNVVLAMNNVGTPRGNGPIKTQDLLWQPLKHVDVHYLATAGAVKQGGANINSADKYTNDEAYDILKIKMYLAGIQLDKEHHADNSELSLMTQVISACAAKGYTLESATSLYLTLRASTEIGTQDHLKALRELFDTLSKEALANFLHVLLKAIIKAINTSSNEDTFAYTIASELIKKAKEGKEVNFSEALLPLSDNTIYAKIFSSVTSFLTKSGIKLKIPGILSVLTPSYNIFLLYAGRKYESYKDPINELKAELEKLDNSPVYSVDNGGSISNVELGRTYKITRIVPSPIDFSIEHNGFSLESAYRKVIYNRLYNIAPKAIKGQITRIINGNSKASLSSIVDKLVSLYPPEELALAKASIISTIKAPISKLIGLTDNGVMYNSEFNYLRHVLGVAGTSPLLINQIVSNSVENVSKALSRYGLEELAPMVVKLASEYSVSNNIPITAETDIEYRLINTPTDYKKLREEVEEGNIIKVSEAVFNHKTEKPIGRDLAAYNVRFSTLDGLSFQLWDLDSALGLFALDQLKKKVDKLKKAYLNTLTLDEKNVILLKVNSSINEFSLSVFGTAWNPKQGEKVNDALKTFETRLRRWLLRDLMNLSESTPPLLELYQLLISKREDTVEWYRRYAQWLNILLGRDGGSSLDFTINLVPLKELIISRNTKAAAQLIGGIDTLRHPDEKGMHFGNPFSHTNFEGVQIVLPTVKDAVNAYEQWLRGEAYLDIEPERRQWILDQINSGRLDNKRLVYYTDTIPDDSYGTKKYDYLTAPNHAHILLKLILEHNPLLIQTTKGGPVNSYNFDLVNEQAIKLLTAMTKVRIGNQLVSVDRSTIKTQAYELIMPKTFKTNFGLLEFDDLNTIATNKNFFIELYLDNRATKKDIVDSLYTVELKVSNGDHYYLLKKGESTAGLTKKEGIQVHREEGKTYRTDINGNILYEITDDTEIYESTDGTEVIVSNDLQFYIDNLHYDAIKLSESLDGNPSAVAEIVKDIQKSSNGAAKLFSRELKNYNNDGLLTSRAIHSITRDNYRSLIRTNELGEEVSENPIIQAGWAKHSSFLKSLDVVAARIPAQSMQSFMPMKVVAYDNPDINTAYVSTMQILLLGSDY